MTDTRLPLKPCTPETVVRDPRTRVMLPPEGAHVPDTSYWRRRIKDGDVRLTTADAITKGKAERLAKEKAATAPAPADVKADTKKAKE